MTKTYTEAFKKEAVHYVLSHPEKTCKEICQEIEIPYGTLKAWLRKIDKSDLPRREAQSPKEWEAEVKRLKREVAVQKTELELLKKFNVYLAKNQV